MLELETAAGESQRQAKLRTEIEAELIGQLDGCGSLGVELRKAVKRILRRAAAQTREAVEKEFQAKWQQESADLRNEIEAQFVAQLEDLGSPRSGTPFERRIRSMILQFREQIEAGTRRLYQTRGSDAIDWSEDQTLIQADFGVAPLDEQLEDLIAQNQHLDQLHTQTRSILVRQSMVITQLREEMDRWTVKLYTILFGRKRHPSATSGSLRGLVEARLEEVLSQNRYLARRH
jgi:hypothetical protein